MKRLLCAIVLGFTAASVYAQDAGDLGGFFLDIPAPRGNAPARGAPARGPAPRGGAAAAPVDRLGHLRELLASSNLPLTMEQETALNGILNVETPLMRQKLQARVLELQRSNGGQATGSAPVAGARGLPASSPSPEELAPEYNRLNDELLG